jgi:hypothetical protein
MTNKPPLVLPPRDLWLKNRTLHCIDSLYFSASEENWNLFREKATEFAKELIYCLEEWDKYYQERKY